MKQIIITFILSLTTAVAVAQTNQYPNTTGTIAKSGYTYKYRSAKIPGLENTVSTTDIELYNSDCKYLDVEWRYKDGSMFQYPFGVDRPADYSSSSISRAQSIALVDGCFTTQQKAALRGKMMSVTARFDPSTGRITDVYFEFLRNDPFANIPVETYRSIELALKQRLTITVTSEGRRLNYIQMYWPQKF